MDDAVLRVFARNLLYAEALVEGLDGEQLVLSGGPGLEDHPAWTLDHLVTGANPRARDLGLTDDLPAGWRETFERRGPGDPRRPPHHWRSTPHRRTVRRAPCHERATAPGRGVAVVARRDETRKYQ